MLNLFVPANALNVLSRLRFCSWHHGRCRVVQIPDKNFGLGCAGRKQIGLKWIEIKCSHGSSVFGLGRHDGVFAGQQTSSIVHLKMTTFASCHNNTVRVLATQTEGAPNNLVEAKIKRIEVFVIELKPINIPMLADLGALQHHVISSFREIRFVHFQNGCST